MSATQTHVVEHRNPDLAWLDRPREDIPDPDLPIVDPHHHLWDRPDSKYELLTDLNFGHNDPVLWNAFKRIATGASTEERHALFHDTAARFYRIDF